MLKLEVEELRQEKSQKLGCDTNFGKVVLLCRFAAQALVVKGYCAAFNGWLFLLVVLFTTTKSG